MSRLFGFLSIVIVLAAGMYIYSQQVKSATAVGGQGSPTGTVNITGVRSDLLSLASAERNYYAQQGKYASLEDLISEKYVTIERSRPPYSYEISTTSSGFQVTASRSTPGSPAKIWIDETMQIQSGD
ncbi:MAG TPA: hypothetical protein VIW67_03000 [Terriglobales bacterium]|jgi:hypothetical protein